jgi:hypothetical protein
MSNPKLVGAGCKCCKCGDKLTGNKTCCCTHICHSICVTLEGGCEDPETGPDACSCLEPSFTYLEYSPETGSYAGEIGCGDILIDLEFVIKYCEESGECVICLVSDCLSNPYGEDFDGECDNAISCKPFGKANQNCIGLKSEELEGVLEGGIEHEWAIDVSNCGDSNCTSYKIRTLCTPRVIPKEVTIDETGCGCTGCSCTCSDLCIGYRGPNTCEAGARVRIDQNVWYFEVGECGSPGQTGRSINVTLEKDDYTGACILRAVTQLITSEGSSENITIIDLTDCPDIPYTKIIVDETSEPNAYFEFECWKCGLCPDELICTCQCDPASPSNRGYVLPDTLNLFWTAYDGIGSDSGHIVLKLRQESFCIWDGGVDIQCESIGDPLYIRYTFTLEPNMPNDSPGNESCGWYLQGVPGFVGNPADLKPGTTCEDRYLGIASTLLSGQSCECDPLELVFSAFPDEQSGTTIEVTE